MAVLTLLLTILIGTVEGLTEFIPVSSTAHILIVGKLFHIPTSAFFTTFTVAIQTGAILAAVAFFWKTLWTDKTLILKVIVGFLPTAVVGITIHSFIEKLFSSTLVIAIALIGGGIALLLIQPNDVDSSSPLSYREAFIIGCTQILAFIPGVSRAGATLIGGTLLKIPRKNIVTFSFLLGIPTIIGAGAVSLQTLPEISFPQLQILALGTLVAFIVALSTIKIFLELLTKQPLKWFGYYRILAGALLLLLL